MRNQEEGIEHSKYGRSMSPDMFKSSIIGRKIENTGQLTINNIEEEIIQRNY